MAIFNIYMILCYIYAVIGNHCTIGLTIFINKNIGINNNYLYLLLYFLTLSHGTQAKYYIVSDL